MTSHAPDPEELLGRFAPPLVPADLADTVLPTARRILVASVEPDRWAALWTSRTMRIAWGLSVAILLASHLSITVRSSSVESSGLTAFSHQVAVGERDREELDEIVDVAVLPRIRVASRTWIGDPQSDPTRSVLGS